MAGCTKTREAVAPSESQKLPMCEGVFDLSKDDPLLAGALNGFSVAEPHGRWTDATEASFTCSLPQANHRFPANVRITTWGYVFAGHTQKALISINQSTEIEEDYGPGSDRKIIDLPLPSSPGGKLRIHFSLPTAVSPQELGMSSDPRKIAISVRSIEFR